MESGGAGLIEETPSRAHPVPFPHTIGSSQQKRQGMVLPWLSFITKTDTVDSKNLPE